MAYIFIENGIINGSGDFECLNDNVINYEPTNELYNALIKNPDYYMWNGQDVVLKPNYEQQQAEKREEQFKKDFFLTSLGYIRRKVTMKTGETKDFLTDLLPSIAMAVNSLQTVNIIAYNEPDYTQDITDWEALQIYIPATPQFIQECFNQISKDFTGI